MTKTVGLQFQKMAGGGLISLMSLLFGGITTLALADDKITAFTADQVHIDPNGKIISSGKFYVTPEKVSMTGMPAGPDGQALSVIYFVTNKRQYILNTQKKLYFEAPFDEQQMIQGIKAMKTDETEKILGTETISGFKCNKKEKSSTVEYMGTKTKMKQIVWVTDMLDMPVRSQTEDGSITELRNFEKGTPPAKYFEVPNDYKKVPNMMAVMGMEFSKEEEEDKNMEQEVANPKNRSFDIPKDLKNLKLPPAKQK
jgi:hypothetical protein